MSYILYGSQTSPFVRRLRILMENIPFELKELSIFEAKDAEILNKINPLNQVPALGDGEKTIWDSRHIFNYLNAKHKFETLDWKDENTLTAIEGAISSGVNLLLMQRSNIQMDDSFMFIRRQRERLDSVLDYLTPKLSEFSEWDFKSMSLFCFLDWAQFRNIISLEKRPEMRAFLEKNANRPSVINTQIPKA